MTLEFCPSCEAERPVQAERRTERYKVRGVQYDVPVDVLVCESCGQSIFDERRDNDLLLGLYARYRNEKGLLTPEEIKAIRRKYNLSQRAFATLLGMSEATINRYEGGALQEDTHETLIRLVSEPEALLAQLGRRGDLLSESQRERARRAAETYLTGARALTPMMPRGEPDKTGGREFDYHRYAAAVNWFCRQLREIHRTKLNKLLFYADFLCFKTTGRSLTGTAYRQLQYGPVPAVYGGLEDAMETDGFIEIETGAYADGKEFYLLKPGPAKPAIAPPFTPDEQNVLAYVARQLGRKSCKAVSDQSHQEDAWVKTPAKQIISYQHAATLSLSMPSEE